MEDDDLITDPNELRAWDQQSTAQGLWGSPSQPAQDDDLITDPNELKAWDQPAQQLPEGSKPLEAESQLVSGLRSAAHAVPSAIGGAAAGAWGAGLGGLAIGGVPGAIIGAIGGGVVGGFAGAFAKDTALEAIGFDDSHQRAINAATHPWTTAGSEAATAVLGGGPGSVARAGLTGLGRLGETAAVRGISAGIGGGFEAGMQLAQGEDADWSRIGSTAVAGGIFARQYDWGNRLQTRGGTFGTRLRPEWQGPIEKPGPWQPEQGPPNIQGPWQPEQGPPNIQGPWQPEQGPPEMQGPRRPTPHGSPGSHGAAGTAEAQPPPSNQPPGQVQTPDVEPPPAAWSPDPTIQHVFDQETPTESGARHDREFPPPGQGITPEQAYRPGEMPPVPRVQEGEVPVQQPTGLEPQVQPVEPPASVARDDRAARAWYETGLDQDGREVLRMRLEHILNKKGELTFNDIDRETTNKMSHLGLYNLKQSLAENPRGALEALFPTAAEAPTPRPQVMEGEAPVRQPTGLEPQVQPVEPPPPRPVIEDSVLHDAGFTDSEIRGKDRLSDTQIRQVQEGYKYIGGEFRKVTPEDLAEYRAAADADAKAYERDKAKLDERFANPKPNDRGYPMVRDILGSDWGAGNRGDTPAGYRDSAYDSLAQKYRFNRFVAGQIERVLQRTGELPPSREMLQADIRQASKAYETATTPEARKAAIETLTAARSKLATFERQEAQAAREAFTEKQKAGPPGKWQDLPGEEKYKRLRESQAVDAEGNVFTISPAITDEGRHVGWELRRNGELTDEGTKTKADIKAIATRMMERKKPAAPAAEPPAAAKPLTVRERNAKRFMGDRTEDDLSLFELLWTRGGLQDHPILRNLFSMANPDAVGKEAFGNRKLLRKNGGLTIDQAVALISREKRFLWDISDIRGGVMNAKPEDLYRLLRDEAAGVKQYQQIQGRKESPTEIARAQDRNLDTIDRAVGNYFETNKKDIGEVPNDVYDRTVQNVAKGETDIARAYEAAVMEGDVTPPPAHAPGEGGVPPPFDFDAPEPPKPKAAPKPEGTAAKNEAEGQGSFPGIAAVGTAKEQAAHGAGKKLTGGDAPAGGMFAPDVGKQVDIDDAVSRQGEVNKGDRVVLANYGGKGPVEGTVQKIIKPSRASRQVTNRYELTLDNGATVTVDRSTFEKPFSSADEMAKPKFAGQTIRLSASKGHEHKDRTGRVLLETTFSKALDKAGTLPGLLAPLTAHVRRKVIEAIGNMPVYVASTADMKRVGKGNAIAYYDLNQNHIVVNGSSVKNPTEMAHSILHEGIHGVTSHTVIGNTKYEDAIKLIKRDVHVAALKREIAASGKSELPHELAYGFTNEREFLAEAFSNTKFQKMLADHILPKDVAAKFQKQLGTQSKIKSAWDAIVATVRKVLNVPPGQMNALEAVMRATESAMKINEAEKVDWMKLSQFGKYKDYSMKVPDEPPVVAKPAPTPEPPAAKSGLSAEQEKFYGKILNQPAFRNKTAASMGVTPKALLEYANAKMKGEQATLKPSTPVVATSSGSSGAAAPGAGTMAKPSTPKPQPVAGQPAFTATPEHIAKALSPYEKNKPFSGMGIQYFHTLAKNGPDGKPEYSLLGGADVIGTYPDAKQANAALKAAHQQYRVAKAATKAAATPPATPAGLPHATGGQPIAGGNTPVPPLPPGTPPTPPVGGAGGGAAGPSLLPAHAKDAVDSWWATLQRIFTPEVRPSGKIGMDVFREQKGTQVDIKDRQLARFDHEAHRAINTMTDADQRKLVDYIEGGIHLNTPGHAIHDPAWRPPPIVQRVVDNLKQAYKVYEQELSNLPQAAQRQFVDDYLTHMYKNPGAVRNEGAGGHGGGLGSLKARKYMTYEEARAAGLEPLTTNPIEIFTRYAINAERALTKQNTMRELEARNRLGWFEPRPIGATGSPEPKITGAAPDHYAEVPSFVNDKGQTAWVPRDMAYMLNHQFAPNGGFSSAATESTANAVRRFKNFTTSVELGLSLYHPFTVGIETVGSGISRALSIARPGNFDTAAKTFANAWLEPFTNVKMGKEWIERKTGKRATTPGEDVILGALTRADIRPVGLAHTMEYDITNLSPDQQKSFGEMGSLWTAHKRGSLQKEFETHLKEIMGGDYKKGMMLIPNMAARILQTSMQPIFEVYIPRVKMASAVRDLQAYIAENPLATQSQIDAVAKKISNSMDNRVGEMVTDHIGMNKVWKAAAFTLMRSYSFTVGGAVREIGGGTLSGVTGALKGENRLSMRSEHYDTRVAYALAFPFAAMALGSIYNYMNTGEWPQDWRDTITPRTGGQVRSGGSEVPERVLIPGYHKDFLGYAFHPLHEAQAKLSAPVSAIIEQFTGKDYRGDPIAPPAGQGLGSHLAGRAAHAGEKLLPISFKQMSEVPKEGSKISWPERALGFRAPGAYIQNQERIAQIQQRYAIKEWRTKERHINADRRARGLEPLPPREFTPR